MTSAQIICDSVSPNGVRLVTMVVRFHRFILAELNTHRVFSRNSASSRAIPSAKMLESVRTDMAKPVKWGKNQSGMQAYEELGPGAAVLAEVRWGEAGMKAAELSENLAKTGVHKQICNRLIEPFLYHTAVITATEWDNFFHQRCSEFAQPEMRALADAMQMAFFTHEPKFINYGGWHLPFIDENDYVPAQRIAEFNRYGAVISEYDIFEITRDIIEIYKKVSVARCARVSYMTHDGKRDLEEDLALYDKLTKGMHWSPFEHVATPLEDTHSTSSKDRFCGNFRGWRQFRKMFEGENRMKFIPNLPELANVAEQMKIVYNVKSDDEGGAVDE